MTINSAVGGNFQQTPIAIQPDVAAGNRAVSAAVRQLNDSIGVNSSHQFSISIDPVTRQAVVRILDSATNEVIEQLPSEYILKVARQLSERIAKQSGTPTDKSL